MMKTTKRSRDAAAVCALVQDVAVPGVRGLKLTVVKPGKRNAYLRALGLDPAKVPQVRHNRKIKLRLV
jgi:hypothetical protein